MYVKLDGFAVGCDAVKFDRLGTKVSEEPIASVVMIKKYARSMSHQLLLVAVNYPSFLF